MRRAFFPMMLSALAGMTFPVPRDNEKGTGKRNKSLSYRTSMDHHWHGWVGEGPRPAWTYRSARRNKSRPAR